MKLDLFGGWAWSPSQWEYELMIQGIYMTLGIMMIISAKNPVRNSMFIWFVVWSSVVHAVIMAYQAAIAVDEMGHFRNCRMHHFVTSSGGQSRQKTDFSDFRETKGLSEVLFKEETCSMPLN